MKKTILLLLLAFGISTISYSQKNLAENTGDHFSLEGALVLFKKSGSPQEFEKLINEEKNNVNNLDLNGDKKTDYINVEDLKDGDSHILVLSTFLGFKEKQDIATIGIEKTGKESAMLQIIGDVALYPPNTIVEPTETVASETKTNKGGPIVSEISTEQIFVNVWFWPCIQFIYTPGYVVWISPYYWEYYPIWWRSWRPYRYPVFYARTAAHRVYAYRTSTPRVITAQRMYTTRRQTSTMVIHNQRSTPTLQPNRRTTLPPPRVNTRNERTRSDGTRSNRARDEKSRK